MKFVSITGSINEEESRRTEERTKYLDDFKDQKRGVLDSFQAQIEKIELDTRKLTATYKNPVFS